MTGTESPATGSQRRGFGIDVGGSGVKGGIVDLDTGQLIGERFKLSTPQPATPDAVARTIAEVVAHFDWDGPLGVTYPGVVTDGIVRTAANVDKDWIGANAKEVIGAALDGQPITVLNDADAAGLAEEKFGAGRDNTGVIVLLTFGTGIGSAVIHNGVLLPNTEFGHIEVGGKEGLPRDPDRWDRIRTQVVSAFTIQHPEHYAVMQVQRVIEQEAEPGQPPPIPEADPTQPVITVVMERDVGDLRFPSAMITLGSAAIFGLLCWLLHQREQILETNLAEAAASNGTA